MSFGKFSQEKESSQHELEVEMILLENRMRDKMVPIRANLAKSTDVNTETLLSFMSILEEVFVYKMKLVKTFENRAIQLDISPAGLSGILATRLWDVLEAPMLAMADEMSIDLQESYKSFLVLRDPYFEALRTKVDVLVDEFTEGIREMVSRVLVESKELYDQGDMVKVDAFFNEERKQLLNAQSEFAEEFKLLLATEIRTNRISLDRLDDRGITAEELTIFLSTDYIRPKMAEKNAYIGGILDELEDKPDWMNMFGVSPN